MHKLSSIVECFSIIISVARRIVNLSRVCESYQTCFMYNRMLQLSNMLCVVFYSVYEADGIQVKCM